MATTNKDFVVKNGLVVEGATATVNSSNILTAASTTSALTSFGTSPTLTTPALGDATATSIVATVASGSTVPLTIQNNGTGNSFVVNDVASDTTPFVIDAAGLVGVGTTSPAAKMHVVDENNAGWRYDQYNNSDGTNFRNYRARGTIDSPTGVLSGDRLGSFLGAGYYGSGFSAINGGMSIFAAETFTETAAGTYLVFGTTAIGANTGGGGTERMRIDSAGLVSITGTLSATSTISASGLAGSLLSSTVGAALGTAAAGTATVPARSDHVHPNTGLGLTASGLNQFAATTSAQLAGVISDETGSGSLVFGTSPTLVTPALGTPSAVVLTSGTGLPISTGVSGLGTGVATFLATPSSANLAAAVTNETGSGSLVFATSPTLTTPNIGAATGTSVALTGDMTTIGDGSTTASPRIFGISSWTASDAAQFRFGDGLNTVQASYGGKMSINAYHGIQLRGAQAGATPSFDAGGAGSDIGVHIVGTSTGSIVLALRGASGQTDLLQKWSSWNGTTDTQVGSFTNAGALAISSTISASGLAGSLLTATTGTALAASASAGTATVPARSDHVHPTTGLGLTASGLNQFAATTSVQLAGVISDETGSGALVFGTSPTITPAAGTTTTAASGAGYMGMPQVTATTGAATVAAADAGKHIYSTATRTITIDSNANLALPVGTTITFIATTGAVVTIAITTDTMYLAGVGTTGSRTLAAHGMATAVKVASTTWYISGNGLS